MDFREFSGQHYNNSKNSKINNLTKKKAEKILL